MDERRTTCPAGSAKQMAILMPFLTLILGRPLEILSPVRAGALLQRDLHPDGNVCPYLTFSTSKHVEWGKSLTASGFFLLESQEKVQFLVNPQTKEQRGRKWDGFKN